MSKTAQDTYRPGDHFMECEMIAYDFGYKEAQIGSTLWDENTSDSLIRIEQNYSERLMILNAYNLGYYHGTLLTWNALEVFNLAPPWLYLDNE